MNTYILMFDELDLDLGWGDTAAAALNNHYDSLDGYGCFRWEDDWPIHTGKITAYELSEEFKVSDEEEEAWLDCSELRTDALMAYIAAHPELKKAELTVTFSSKGREIR